MAVTGGAATPHQSSDAASAAAWINLREKRAAVMMKGCCYGLLCLTIFCVGTGHTLAKDRCVKTRRSVIVGFCAATVPLKARATNRRTMFIVPSADPGPLLFPSVQFDDSTRSVDYKFKGSHDVHSE